MRTRRNHVFASAMEALGDGYTNRELAALGGVSHTSIGDWNFGIVPTYATLDRFFRELQSSERPADQAKVVAVYRAAGYPMAAWLDLPTLTPHQHLVEGLAALAAEFGTAIPVNWDVEAVKNLTMEDAEIILAEHRASAEKMRKKGVI